MNIKSVKPTHKTGYKQGYFVPKNPEKYSADPSEIIYRSSWELKFFQYCDDNDNIVEWGSENFSVVYWNPIQKKTSNYWIDCYMVTKNADGSTMKWLVEIKPDKYLHPPTPPTRLTEKQTLNYARHAKAYIINSEKFKAAKAYAAKNNMRFGIITENFLFNKV